MSDARLISSRIEKEYDPIRNEWDTRIQFLIHDNALYSGLLAEIPPVQLHTLICLSLFMKDNGKIEISVADLARALGISFQLAKKRIEDLLAFRFHDKPILQINKTRDATVENEHLSLSILPLSPITFVDERENRKEDAFSGRNSDYLFEYLRMMLGVARLSEQEKELLHSLQTYPYELPPQVIEVLIEHVMEHKQMFDRQYPMTIAHSWSISGIYTKEQAYRWIGQTKMLSSPARTEAPEAYLLQYLRERIRKQPSAVQINMIFQLLEEPYLLEPGCVEVLIDHVVGQIAITKGKPDFPKKYVEVVVQEWFERGVRTREAAIREVEEWNRRYSMKPDLTDRKDKRDAMGKPQAASKVKSEYLDKLRKAGLK